MPKALALTILSIAAGLAGCAASVRIDSNRAAGFSIEPKRIFVVSEVGNEYGAEFTQGFQSRLRAIAAECGAVLDLSQMSTLELNSNVHVSRARAFNADLLLTVRRGGGTRDQYGNIIHVIYDARAFDARADKPVWRASIDFRGPGMAGQRAERAGVLAGELTNRLKNDGIWRGCAPVKIGP